MVGTTEGAVSTRLIGSALRQAREAREAVDPGFSLRKVAVRLGMAHSKLSRIENGRLSATPKVIAQIGEALGMSATQIGELLADTNQVGGDRWIATKHADRKLQMQALLSFEQRATAIIDVSPGLIPGLLQTPDYTKAIMLGAGLPDWEIEQRVQERSGRARMLFRPRNPTMLTALIGEEALRRVVGDPAIMNEQLLDLWGWADPARANIDIRVIPASAGYYPGVESGYVDLDFGGEQPPLVHVETVTTGLFLTDKIDIAAYRKAADTVRDVALSQSDSRDYIAHAAHLHETAGSEIVA